MKKQNTANNGRAQATRAAIGSIRCEGLRPTASTSRHLRNYSSGKISASQLHVSVMSEVESILARSNR